MKGLEPSGALWLGSPMLKRISRLFVIKTRFEACVIIYALALGALARGEDYLAVYPGFPGYLMLAATTGAVFLAGAKLMEVTRPDTGKRRRKSDIQPQ